jgi:hypothetical protein
MKMTVWGVTLYCLVNFHHYIRGTCSLLFQVRRLLFQVEYLPQDKNLKSHSLMKNLWIQVKNITKITYWMELCTKHISTLSILLNRYMCACITFTFLCSWTQFLRPSLLFTQEDMTMYRCRGMFKICVERCQNHASTVKWWNNTCVLTHRLIALLKRFEILEIKFSFKSRFW